jgi:hypothetical protein
MGGQPLQYRLWGSNTDTLIFPHLVQPSRVKALGLGSSYQRQRVCEPPAA